MSGYHVSCLTFLYKTTDGYSASVQCRKHGLYVLSHTNHRLVKILNPKPCPYKPLSGKNVESQTLSLQTIGW